MTDLTYVKTIHIHFDEEYLLKGFVEECLEDWLADNLADYAEEEEVLPCLSDSDREEIVSILYKKLLKKLDR